MPTVMVRACEGESEIDMSVSVAFLRDLLSSRSCLTRIKLDEAMGACLTQCEKQPGTLDFPIA